MVAGLVLAIALGAAGTWHEAQRLNHVRNQSRDQLRPAQLAAASLAEAYYAQESGQESYMLAGNRSSLQPFTSGVAQADQLTPVLRRLLAFDPVAEQRLTAAEASVAQWRTSIALPQIAARGLGAIPSSQLVSMALAGIPHTVEIRAQLDALSSRIAVLVSWSQQRYDAALHTANITTATAIGLALVAVLLVLLIFMRMLTRPLRDLLLQIRKVAGGAYETVIVPQGAREIAQIGDSVETLRHNLVSSSKALISAHEQMVLRDERDRIAADLHDMTIQRVFGIGLMVRALGQRHPELLADVENVVEASDETIRELRNLIFGFRSDVLSGAPSDLVRELVEDASRSLGFVPTLEVGPDVNALTNEETVVELLAALREMLSNVARHAHATAAQVSLTIEGDELHLNVTDNGVGVSPNARQGNGHANLLARASRLGGRVTVQGALGGGTSVDWEVPAR